MSLFLLLIKQIKDGLKMYIAVCYRGQTIKCTPTGPRSLVGKLEEDPNRKLIRERLGFSKLEF